MNPEVLNNTTTKEEKYAAEALRFVNQFAGSTSPFEQMIYEQSKDSPDAQLTLAALENRYALQNWFWIERSPEVEAELCSLLEKYLAIPHVSLPENITDQIRIGGEINNLLRSQT